MKHHKFNQNTRRTTIWAEHIGNKINECNCGSMITARDGVEAFVKKYNSKNNK